MSIETSIVYMHEVHYIELWAHLCMQYRMIATAVNNIRKQNTQRIAAQQTKVLYLCTVILYVHYVDEIKL